MKVILLAAMTLDGKLARNASHFVDWTSREDKRLFFSASKQAGVIIMGNNTYKTLPSPLPGRLHVVLTRDPAGKAGVPGVVEYTDQPPASVLANLEGRGYTEAVLGGGPQANALFLQAGLLDELWLTVEPVIFGEGVGLFEGVPFDLRAELVSMERLNEQGAVHLRYRLG